MQRLIVTALLAVLPLPAGAQDARTVIDEATRALGAAGVTAITYSGTAAVANFGQSRTISFGLASTTVRNYTRTIDLSRGTSRVTGYVAPPTVHGGPPPGVFEEVISPADPWSRQLEIWITPWGFLHGARGAAASVRSRTIDDVSYSVVTWSPPQKAPSGRPYQIVGYLGPDRLVERVETWVEHPIFGDMHVETTYGDYRNVTGVLVPARISQSRVGMEVFVAAIAAARRNPSDLEQLLKPASVRPAPAADVRPAAAERLADGIYRIAGDYEALLVELPEYLVVIGGGGSEARGHAILAEAKLLFPKKPIRYAVATHPHFDHAAVLPPFAAEGITILIDDPSRYFMEQALSSPRTLVGDALARSRRKPKVQGVVEKLVLGEGPRRLELHHLPRFEHSDAMLVAYLPAERILFTADVDASAPDLSELGLDVERHLRVQP